MTPKDAPARYVLEERFEHGRERTSAGSILYVPIFQKGGLIWTGDSHCLQGGGEVNLTALECSYKSIEIQPIVRKDLHIEWPRAETATHWVFMDSMRI